MSFLCVKNSFKLEVIDFNLLYLATMDNDDPFSVYIAGKRNSDELVLV